jgi:hypothetical protein
MEGTKVKDKLKLWSKHGKRRRGLGVSSTFRYDQTQKLDGEKTTGRPMENWQVPPTMTKRKAQVVSESMISVVLQRVVRM